MGEPWKIEESCCSILDGETLPGDILLKRVGIMGEEKWTKHWGLWDLWIPSIWSDFLHMKANHCHTVLLIPRFIRTVLWLTMLKAVKRYKVNIVKGCVLTASSRPFQGWCEWLRHSLHWMCSSANMDTVHSTGRFDSGLIVALLRLVSITRSLENSFNHS